MKRLRVFCLVLVLCITAVSACSALAEPYEFTFLSTWNESEDKVQLLTALTEQYKAEVNPDFNFNLSVIASDDLQRQIKIYVASNEMPEMFVYYWRPAAPRAYRGRSGREYERHLRLSVP